MSENRVVLATDLALFNDDDGLKFDGVSDSALGVPISMSTWSYSIAIRFSEDSLTGLHVYCGTQNSSGISPRAYLSISGGFLSYGVGNSAASNNVTSFQVSSEEVYNIHATFDGSTFTLSVDGDVISTKNVAIDTLTNYLNIGAYAVGADSVIFNTACSIYSFSYSDGVKTYTYIQNGDFGSPTLIDHSGNGNDGTINGATWWKQGVDQFFDDWLVYKSQLPVTPVVFQSVTRIDVYSPDTGDPLWEAYSDPQWLVVIDQISFNFIYWLLTQSEEEDMETIKDHVLGSDVLAASPLYTVKRPAITHLKSSVAGTLSVKLQDASDFITIGVLDSNVFYPIGAVKEIDVDSADTTVDLNSVVFGKAYRKK